uniref:DH domain-containing protein n=1 Tax=Photinus pyralis TaxID=7054 RepID=A0A1Y1JXM7_PHOPY
MSAQVNMINWSKTLSLDRRISSPVYHGFIDIDQPSQRFPHYTAPYMRSAKITAYQTSNNCDSVASKSSLNSSYLRRNVEESRKVFLNLCETKDEESQPPDPNKENMEQKKSPTRKISFKCSKKPSFRRTAPNSGKLAALNPNTVAELTSKFNEMLSDRVPILEQPKFARLVRRVNSLKATPPAQVDITNKKVARKPSVKIKPANLDDSKRPQHFSSQTNLELRQNDEKSAVKTETTGTVRATIQIFERRSSESRTPENEVKTIVKELEKVPKPKVPEKSPNIKTKDLVIKNGVKKLKALDIRDDTSVNQFPVDSSNVPKQIEGGDQEKKTDEEEVQILNIPLVMPRRCDSKYETLNLRKIHPTDSNTLVKPNTSFLWRQKSLEAQTDWKSLYDAVGSASQDLKPEPPAIPPRPTSLNLAKRPLAPKAINKKKMPLPTEHDDTMYELVTGGHNYEYLSRYDANEQNADDGYECFDPIEESPKKPESEQIYETLPCRRKQEQPLPPRPPSSILQKGEAFSNCYESIYQLSSKNTNEETFSNNYESIYGCNIQIDNWELGSNRDSMVSSDQQSNSLYSRSLSGWPNDGSIYNGKAASDLSGSDKSDEWIDISDNEENSKSLSGLVIVRERTRNKKSAGWSQKIRDQWNKSHSIEEDNSDSDHHYETLCNTQEEPDHDGFDSFDSDTESERSLDKVQNDSWVDLGNSQLPDPPTSQSYGLTQLAVSAGKRLRRNWSLTKNITKSLTRMTKRKSRTDLTIGAVEKQSEENSNTNPKQPISSPVKSERNSSLLNITQELKLRQNELSSNIAYQNIQIASRETEPTVNFEKSRSNSLSKNKFLNKFRRSMLINADSTECIQTLGNKMKSTFYLTDPIEVDNNQTDALKSKAAITTSVSPVALRHSKSCQRPQSPPPPVPVDANQNVDSRTAKTTRRSTSWYAEVGLFRNSENPAMRHSDSINICPRKPNTSWYAEIGLYQSSSSTPSSSSTENSGNTTNLKQFEDSKASEDYYNIKNESDYYNDSSIGSFNSDTTIDKNSMSADMQLRLQDEPLYQFYDAAVLESVCQDGTSDFEYDGYEEVGEKQNSEMNLARPSAMQLIAYSKNGFTITRTLWCEIPEVVNSTVLSTLSLNQKKIQEAKFEMMTSEASYLNSLNLLTDYFISNINSSDFVTNEEKTILFGKIAAVKQCSEELLSDLEKCWQGNILLHGICDIVKKHAQEHFDVYVPYCENQILLDSTLKKMRERNSCNDLLKRLECSSECHSLTLYSFLMLPMQRITRWPLLVDAVLKRLSPQDDEYVSCQHTLATLNGIVTRCNEAARRMERESEVKRIAKQIEFPRGIPIIKLVTNTRWLVRSGPLIQMVARADDNKLTFGKRFSKTSLYFFLFNDLLLVTSHRSDDCYVVLHYCYRSYIELNINDVISSVPAKDAQGKHLLFLTILENHDKKTVEMLLSCNSESDKERWIEALSAPKSEDPDETLYECWDCPQVTAIHPYISSQPDELPLARGDIVNVTRKMADGWYHGERIRDGETGWFPANYTAEIANPHVRARNLKQRYRLLALSENYLKSK